MRNALSTSLGCIVPRSYNASENFDAAVPFWTLSNSAQPLKPKHSTLLPQHDVADAAGGNADGGGVRERIAGRPGLFCKSFFLGGSTLGHLRGIAVEKKTPPIRLYVVWALDRYTLRSRA